MLPGQLIVSDGEFPQSDLPQAHVDEIGAVADLVLLCAERIEIALEENAPKSLVGELSKKLADWTGRRWMVIVSSEPGMPSIYAQEQARKDELKDGVRDDPGETRHVRRGKGPVVVVLRCGVRDEDMCHQRQAPPGHLHLGRVSAQRHRDPRAHRRGRVTDQLRGHYAASIFRTPK